MARKILTSEQRSENAKKAWVTRRANHAKFIEENIRKAKMEKEKKRRERANIEIQEMKKQRGRVQK